MCVSPIQGYRAFGGGLTFSPHSSFLRSQVTVPCGKCLECRLKRIYDWQGRLHLEYLSYDCFASFVTLTYNDEHLPLDKSLNTRDLQLFFKRLRKKCDNKIRYYASGEYGPLDQRPHYHTVIFGYFPDDFEKIGKNGTSASLEALWGNGYVTVDNVTPARLAYVAKYCLKKKYGQQAQEYYNGRKSEFAIQSKGFGMLIVDKYIDQIILNRGYSVDGKHYRLSRAILDRIEKFKGKEYRDDLTKEMMLEHPPEDLSQGITWRHLYAKNVILKSKMRSKI